MIDSRSYTRRVIRPDMTVRQIAADFPATQDVFRRHGETDRPLARFGHLESVTHFARRQGIMVDQLLGELATAAAAPVEISCRAAERVHRAFVLAALGFTLTLGAAWGAWLLWKISTARNFQEAPVAQLVGHGETQLWRFVVLFVMGVSLATVLISAVRRWGRAVPRGLLTLVVVGTLSGFAWSLRPDMYPFLGHISTASLMLAAICYSALQWLVLRVRWPATSARAVIAFGLWLIAWAGGAVTILVDEEAKNLTVAEGSDVTIDGSILTVTDRLCVE